jgi:hypothetical protein
MRAATRCFAGAMIVGTALAASGSSAATLPAAQYFVNLSHHEYYPADPEYHMAQSLSAPGTYGLPGTSAVSAAIQAGPAATAYAYAAADWQQKSSSDASFIYYFEITGPTAGVSVPVVVNTYLNESITFDSYNAGSNQYGSGNPGYIYGAGASISVIAATSANLAISCTKASYADPSCSDPGFFSGGLAVTATTGTAHEILVSAYARVDGTQTFGRVIAESFADPMISFAPGFDATGYSIALSDGVGNALSVPEPAAGVLLSVGVFGIGLRRPRRQRFTD